MIASVALLHRAAHPGRNAASQPGNTAAPASAVPSAGIFAAWWAATSRVESEPGRGSTFTIRLPRIVDALNEAVVANSAYTEEAVLKHR
jgi:hypothetical protein